MIHVELLYGKPLLNGARERVCANCQGSAVIAVTLGKRAIALCVKCSQALSTELSSELTAYTRIAK